jgi:hypothetical protein
MCCSVEATLPQLTDEQLPTEDDVTTTTTDLYDLLRERANALSEQTGLTLQVGYIGNCEGNSNFLRYDDRSWTVWCANAKTGPFKTVNFGYFSTDKLDQLLERVTLDNLRKALVGSYPYEVKDAFLNVTCTYEESKRLLDSNLPS